MTSRFAETRARRPKAETLDLVATTSGDDDAAATMVDQIAVVIRQAILQGQYGPGERIKVAEIAQRFGFSSMPIREALRKLEGEGIVLIAPNRGATVRTLDRPFIEDLYDVRTALELLAVRRALERMTLDKLDRLEALWQAHKQAVLDGNIPVAVDTNRKLHVALFEIAGNGEATRLFERGWETIYALRLRFGYQPGRLETIVSEHRLLIDALRRSDLATAETLIRMHNRAGLEDLLSRFAI